MGTVVPLRPTPPRPKTVAERAVWSIWQPVDAPFVFSFDRWRAAEIARVAASRRSPGTDWVGPFACHVDYFARRLDPVPDDGEILRVIRRLVGLVVPLTAAVAEMIEEGRGRYRPRAYELAVELDVSPAEKIRLGLRTIRDVSETNDVMRARRLARRRARDAAKRRAAGAETRDVRAMRRALVGALATTATISQATAYRWLKSAENSGEIDMARVTEREFGRLVSSLINTGGRADSQNVTPAAERKRRSRARLKAKAGALNAPAAAVAVVPDRPTLAELAADALTVPRDDVTFDPDRRVISIRFRPVRLMPPDFDPSHAVGEVLRLGGRPIAATPFAGDVVEIGIGEAA